MNKVFSVILFVPTYLLFIFLLIYLTIVRSEVQSFEEYKLAVSIDYAVDAATAEMITTTDLGMDNYDPNRIDVDPDLALEVFTKVLAFNYNLPQIEPTLFILQKNCIKQFAVAAYDGIYIYTFNPYTQELVSTPKLPYRYTEGNTHYALNLGLHTVYKLHNGTLSSTFLEDTPISKNQAIAAINTRISDLLMKSLDETYRHGAERSVYIPIGLTKVRSVNPVKSPSVLAFIDDMAITTTTPISAFSIGGARIERSEKVVAYERYPDPVNQPGVRVKYYCYASQLPDTYSGAIVAIYDSVYEAAKAGYYHDSLFMDN